MFIVHRSDEIHTRVLIEVLLQGTAASASSVNQLPGGAPEDSAVTELSSAAVPVSV